MSDFGDENSFDNQDSANTTNALAPDRFTSPSQPSWPVGGYPVHDTAPPPQSSSWDWLKNIFSGSGDSPTNTGQWSDPLKPLDRQNVNTDWSKVTEAQGVLQNIPETTGGWGDKLNQEYDPDGSEAGFHTSPFGKKLISGGISLGRGLLNMNPIGAAGNAVYDLSQGANPLKVAMNAVPGIPQGVKTAYNIGSSDNPQQAAGQTLSGIVAGNMGGQIGNNVAGPIGGIAGSILGPKLMNASYTPPTGGSTAGTPMPQQSSSTSNGFDLGAGLQGLAGLYANNQSLEANRRLMEQGQGAIQNQMTQLGDMYGQNSPYAAAMRESLARQDARAGRNSQYGPREAQLQALLAEKGAQRAAQMGQLATQQNTIGTAGNLRDQELQREQLGGVLRLGQQSGLFDWAGGGLKDMWNKYNAPQQQSFSAPTGEWA